MKILKNLKEFKAIFSGNIVFNYSMFEIHYKTEKRFDVFTDIELMNKELWDHITQKEGVIQSIRNRLDYDQRYTFRVDVIYTCASGMDMISVIGKSS